MKDRKIALAFIAILVALFMLISSLGMGNYAQQPNASPQLQDSAAKLPSNYSFYHYNPSKAVNYGNLVDSKYKHKSQYPAGIDESILQKNLDAYGSEDCAHFVSEALIAGGLTVLATNPPGDNLNGFDGGQFVGSYGIVGVYRLADYLAGYNLPVFSTNATVESTRQYQPIPSSYNGSPLASVYYVTNDSMFPAYFLSPGDVVVDGGVGGGHVMLYIGGGTVVQTDPAGKWQYGPGPYLGDLNISFNGMDTLNGQNVSSLYMHIPTFSSAHSVSITVLSNGNPIKDSSVLSISSVPVGESLTLIGSFPDGVGIGNYTYQWYDNGNPISNQQVLSFTPYPGANTLKLESSGSNGTATSYFTFYSGAVPNSAYLYIHPGQDFITVYLTFAAIAAVIAGIVIVVYKRNTKKGE